MYKYFSNGAFQPSGATIYLEFRQPVISAEVNSISVKGSGTAWEGSGTESAPFVVELAPDDLTANGPHVELDIDVDIDVIEDPLGFTVATVPGHHSYRLGQGLTDINYSWPTATMSRSHLPLISPGVYEYGFFFRFTDPGIPHLEIEPPVYIEFRRPRVTVNSISLPVSGLVWPGSGTETDPFVVDYTQADVDGDQFLIDIDMDIEDPMGFTQGGTYFNFFPKSPYVALVPGHYPEIYPHSLSPLDDFPSMRPSELSNLPAGVYRYDFRYRAKKNVGNQRPWSESDSSVYLLLGGPYGEMVAEEVVEEEELVEEEVEFEEEAEEEIAEVGEEVEGDVTEFIAELVSVYEAQETESFERLVSEEYSEIRTTDEDEERLDYYALIDAVRGEVDVAGAFQIKHSIRRVRSDENGVRVEIQWQMDFEDARSGRTLVRKGRTELVVADIEGWQLITQRQEPLFGAITSESLEGGGMRNRRPDPVRRERPTGRRGG